MSEKNATGNFSPCAGSHPLPEVPPKRTEVLTEEERRLQREMLKRAEEFADNPEYAICKKIGIGACFEF